MALSPPPRLQQSPDAGSFTSGASTAPSVDTSVGASPAPPESDPGAMEDMNDILSITTAARRLASKYPSAVPEVMAITDAVQKMQMKIMQVQPPSEVAAPPQ